MINHGGWDHQFEYVFTEKIRKSSFNRANQVFGFEKMLLFSSEEMFQFFTNGTCKFQKEVKSAVHGKTIIL